MASPFGLSIYQGNWISYMVASSLPKCIFQERICENNQPPYGQVQDCQSINFASFGGGGSPGSLWEGSSFEDCHLWRLPAAEA